MRIQGSWICDGEGRVLLLRGCNIGGSTKVPALDGEDGGEVSFAGKPFPLDEAEERFAEMRRWGLYCNRLVVPWEAIEHEGPGVYDEAYLAYLRKLLAAAEKQGIRVWIDPHQDVWGRAAGGDGAPAWTLEALGINTGALEAAGAILPARVTEIKPPNQRPLMTWPAGNNRYAAATMWTLFFAGGVYAPALRINGEAAGDWLQRRFIEAFAHAKRRLKNCASIAGWGTLNEPHPGFIGYTNLNKLENNMVAVGAMPSPFAAMAASSGHRVEVPVYSTGIFGVKQKGWETLNPKGVSVFKEGFVCPWKTAGVWTDGDGTGQPRLLKPDYFACYKGRPARFARDFLSPFIDRFRERLASTDEKSLFFIEGVPSGLGTGDDEVTKDTRRIAETAETAAPERTSPAARTVHAFHWYDAPTLFIKQFRPWFNFDIKTGKIILGRKNVAALYREQIASHIVPGMPNLVGEFGFPFDIFKGRTFSTGDYSLHEEALGMYYDVMDEFLLGACIWDYSADNTFRWGDSWNNEDFSIVTRGESYNPADDAGKAAPLKPRAEGGWFRPYPLATAGTPLAFSWNRKTKTLRFRYRANPELAVPTMLFIPQNLWQAKSTLSVVTTARTHPQEKPAITTGYTNEEQLLLVHHNGFDGEVDISMK